MNEFAKDSIYFGGGYNGRCLSSSIDGMKEKLSLGQIWGIKDLVLNSPEDCRRTLKTDQIWGIDPSRVISLEETIERLGMNS